MKRDKKNKGGAPKGNENARKERPEFPDYDLNTMEGIDKALQKLIKLTWEGKIDNRTSASLRNQLKYLAELHFSQPLLPTKEEVMMLSILAVEEKEFREKLIDHFVEYLEEHRPTRWEDVRFEEINAESITYSFSYSLPEDLRKPFREYLEKIEKE